MFTTCPAESVPLRSGEKGPSPLRASFTSITLPLVSRLRCYHPDAQLSDLNLQFLPCACEISAQLFDLMMKMLFV